MKKLDSKNFKDSTSKGVVLVDMYADWCGPCRALSPILDELEKTIAGVEFAKLNVDEANDIAQEYQVISIPCVIIFKDGKEFDRIIGLNPKSTYIQVMDKAVSGN
jgi:thioredoxin 1